MVIRHTEGNNALVHAVLHVTVYNTRVPHWFVGQIPVSLSYVAQQPGVGGWGVGVSPERQRWMEQSKGSSWRALRGER